MRKQTAKWTTADGSKIRICDMGDGHLLRCIRMLDRDFEFQIQAMEMDAVYLSGDLALYYAERGYEAMLRSTPEDHWPIYGKLAMEVERRGLKPLKDGKVSEQATEAIKARRKKRRAKR